jgi:hypothetical protein
MIKNTKNLNFLKTLQQIKTWLSIFRKTILKIYFQNPASKFTIYI